jgi:hypothetical protein
VALLIQDSTDSELCSRLARFALERTAEIDSHSPESTLYLDLLPMIVALLDSSLEEGVYAAKKSPILVQQTALVAIETHACSFCLQWSNDTSGRLNYFTVVLNHASSLIRIHAAHFEVQRHVVPAVEGTSCHLLCSAALCASTLARVLKAHSLSLLPNLIETLLAVLSAVNDALARKPSQLSATNWGQAMLLRIFILRTFMAMADPLPQFLAPYLDRLLSPSLLLSGLLRSESSEHQLAVNWTTT